MSKWVRVGSIILPLALIVAGLSALVIWSREPDRFPLRKVEVRSVLKYVREDEIEAAVSPFLAKGFFWLNVRSVQANLQQIPWVQSVGVRRVWPDRLQVLVQERTAQARWGDKGVLSTEGVIFYPAPDTISDKLPRFDGPNGYAKEMLENYLTFLEVLGPIGLTVQSVGLSPNGSWQIMLDNDVAVILGKTALVERLARFVLAYQSRLQTEKEHIAYVDLRYTNGFAIGWKKGVQNEKKREELTHHVQEAR